MPKDANSFFPDTPMTLIAQFADRARQDGAWRGFYALYGRVVYRMALAAGLKRDDAEDVLASVMRNFYQSVCGGFKLRPKPERFRTYLRKITNRQIAEHRRARRGAMPDPAELNRWASGPASSQTDSAWTQIESEEYLWLCLEKLRDLPEVRRRDFDAFVRYTLHGESAAQVSREFGLTEAGLYRLRHRLLGHLRSIHAGLQREDANPAESPESRGKQGSTSKKREKY